MEEIQNFLMFNASWRNGLMGTSLNLTRRAKSCTLEGITPYMLGAIHLEINFARKDPGVPVDIKLDLTHHCGPAAKKAYGILGFIRRSFPRAGNLGFCLGLA